MRVGYASIRSISCRRTWLIDLPHFDLSAIGYPALGEMGMLERLQRHPIIGFGEGSGESWRHNQVVNPAPVVVKDALEANDAARALRDGWKIYFGYDGDRLVAERM